jgi:hypothetical protein
MKEKVIEIMLGWVQHNEPIEATADKLLDLFAVSDWRDFTTPPIAGQEILIVWPSGNYSPERRVLTEEDLKQDWSDMRWIPIPAYR